MLGGGGASTPKAIADRPHAPTGLASIEGHGMAEAMAATHLDPVDAPGGNPGACWSSASTHG